MRRILLHACCGPCSLMPLRSLIDEGWSPTLLWYNPNIHPEDEWLRRRDALREVSARLSVPLIEEGGIPVPALWVEGLGGITAEGDRCLLCYRPRMEAAARIAAEQGFDAFTTSLLYSIYQRHDAIRSEAVRAAEDFGAGFLYRDFRTFWHAGIALSRELGIYRQKWCGCILSMGEALRQQKQAAERKAAEKAEKAARLAREAEERSIRRQAAAVRKERKAQRRRERIEALSAHGENQHGNQDEGASDPSHGREILIP